MVGLVFAIISVIVALILLACSKWASETKGERVGFAIASAIFGGLAILLVLLSSIQIVSTRNVGVETVFGHTSGELSNGLHLTAPWVNVTEMDAAVQTDTYSDHADNADGPCINIRIANQQTACVDVSIRWRIDPKAADELFQNYHTFDHVRNSLVTRELVAAMNQQLAAYNPLNSVQYTGATQSGPAPPKNPSYGEIGSRVKSEMQSELGNQINVLSVIVTYVAFDSQTQNRINQLQQQVALTRIADQAQATATAQAAANHNLAASVNNDPNVLVSRCIDVLQEMVKNGQAVPAGFSCWPGGGVAGVIANTTKAPDVTVNTGH